MLQPLQLSARLAPASLASSAAITTAPTTATALAPTPPSALSKVLNVEGIAVPSKTKASNGPSLYNIDLYFCVPGRPSAMLSPTWKIGLDMGDRAPDARATKSYVEALGAYDAIKKLVKNCEYGKQRCRLCKMLHGYGQDDLHAPAFIDRALIGTERKCERLADVLSKLVYMVVRAQRPSRPNDPFVPSCPNQTAIAELLVTCLEL